MIVFDCTKFPAEPAVHDEALSRAADLAHMSENTAIIWLYPVPFRSIHVEACMRKVRLAEDRMLANGLCMMHEFSIAFVTPDHAGDRRCLMQRGRLLLSKAATGNGENSPWCETGMARGRLPGPPVELARLKDIVAANIGLTPVEMAKAKALGPSDRVAQRGAAATAAILKHMVAELNMTSSDALLVANFLPNQSDDWGVATWELERSSGSNVHYMALPTTDSGCAELLKKRLFGILMEQWWETRGDAGSRDPVGLPEVSKEGPSLRVASWVDGNPVLAEGLLDRFPPDSPQGLEWRNHVQAFWAKFGRQQSKGADAIQPREVPTEGTGPDLQSEPDLQDTKTPLELEAEPGSLDDFLAKPDSFWHPRQSG